ncbi:MAG: LptF/LptG family permease [Thermoguttaceae bacterium]|nr:LptF/LptG family permease [Thermoguttaceae bacterium]MDW8038712.1 LptF/LptG family permease [Thermoguttaceae bacterium]
MGIIDRYLLRQFVQTFVICFLSLWGLYVVFDLFTNLEEFLQAGEKTGNLWGLIGEFYGYQAIGFFDRTSGLLALISAMATLAWLERHNELTALMAAGISKLRIAAPVVIASVVVTLLAAVNRETLIPRYRQQLARKTTDLLGDRPQVMAPCYDTSTKILFRGSAIYTKNQRIEKPDLLLPPGLDQYGTTLVAENAFYRAANQHHPAGYLLEGVRQPTGLDKRPSLRKDGQPVIITPLDAADWLGPGQCFVVSDLAFEQLTGGLAWRQYASTRELIQGLRSKGLEFGADVRVTIHSRFVQPLLDLTLLFLGLPLVLRREMRNVFLALGTCLVLVAGFMGVVFACQYLGSIYLLSPSLAAWLPLFVFVPAAVAISEPLWERTHRRRLRPA